VDLGGLSHVRFIFKLALFLRQWQPDQALVSQHHLGVFFVLARLLARSKTRTIVVLHNNLSGLLVRERFSRLLLISIRLSYRWSDVIVCVSEGVQHDFRCRFPSLAGKLRVIYNPVPIEEILVKAGESRSGHPWLDEKEDPVVLALGRFVPQKDFACLIQSVAIARDRCSCRLILVGDGVLRESLLNLVGELGITDYVRIVGHQDNPYKLMKNADVVAVSSRWEGFGLTIVEALALGIPVVATDCPSGPAEILEGGRFGRLVPVGDTESLATAIHDSISTGSVATASEQRQRAKDFSEEVVFPQYIEILNSDYLEREP
jgi:glycosyltransferase involved in cell wall biosynthesis